MKSLKRHIALIVPLIAILFSLESVLSIMRLQSLYEINLSKAYSIIVASSRPLKDEDIALKIPEFKSLNEIDSDMIVQKLKGEVREENIERLKGVLPYYYSITLSYFPNQKRLAQITEQIQQIKDIKRVESFNKAHDRIYRLLLLLKTTIIFFAIPMFLVSLLLMVKQIEVWHFEHRERMEIMTLLGAPNWLRNGLLFRLAIVDSILATFLLTGITIYFGSHGFLLTLFSEIGVHGHVFYPQTDFFILLVSSLCISNFSVLAVIARITRERRKGLQ
ncbi:hypothetical protein CCZ01_02325 [Helicobacter monodelphidis]|uniref:FtsX-like permease family protein n=1 Tax=Helicobacter sp. 15-1451 TaxID=2004995 RepID=UPI000DCC9693|nr:FtsX-like permease family protein [Helicobacter sp. 15-1451]RAX58639.1 hypothetical protein CCZ01_02325 [Helicobacter sp. 15-1451]